MAQSHAGYERDDPYEPSSGPNFDAAIDQHNRARLSTESDSINWLPVVGGGLLVGMGLGRGRDDGLLLTLLGGGLVYWGLSRGIAALPSVPGRLSAPNGERSIRVERVITINRPPSEVYA
ncbi:MAG: hypothetical protein M3439_01480, partial [Chloroflexota bacterium]|nr:hypothetical protein [Chloroflexota bacterium]